MIQVRFIGGPRDGQYDNWAMHGGRPPFVIEAVTARPLSWADTWIPENDSPPGQESMAYTRHSYYRLGTRDATGAELYATDEVRRELDRLGMISVPSPQPTVAACFLGGACHGEVMNIPSPPQRLLRIPVTGTGMSAMMPDGPADPGEEVYYCLTGSRDNNRALLYISRLHMMDVVRGVMPVIPDTPLEVLRLVELEVARYARLVEALGSMVSGLTGRRGNPPYDPRFDEAYMTEARMSGKKPYPFEPVRKGDTEQLLAHIDEITDEGAGPPES